MGFKDECFERPLYFERTCGFSVGPTCSLRLQGKILPSKWQGLEDTVYPMAPAPLCPVRLSLGE